MTQYEARLFYYIDGLCLSSASRELVESQMPNLFSVDSSKLRKSSTACYQLLGNGDNKDNAETDKARIRNETLGHVAVCHAALLCQIAIAVT